MEQELTRLIERALARSGYGEAACTVAPTSDPAHGDYTTNIALVLSKAAQEASQAVAEKLVNTLDRPAWLAEVSIAGPGFINFTLARTYFRDRIREALRAGESWGKGTRYAGKKVMVEHTQPNPFKPFHIGHLMSNTIGESIARLYAFSGATVRTANWQGDVGLHVAKALWGLRKIGGDPSNLDDLGRAYVEGNRAYEDEEQAKREIAEVNAMVYADASAMRDAYRIGRETSLRHFERLYELLGSRFDYYFFESEGVAPGRTLVKEGLSKGIFTESEGAVVFRGEEYGLHTRVFLTSQDLPTYEAKELGLAHLKAEKWDFDLSITTTAVEQAEYFKVVFKVLSLLRPELRDKLLHVPHGMMQLSSGKMSSRRGNVITGETLIADMLAVAREKVAERDLPDADKEAIARAVAIGAIKYSVQKQKAGKNITFDPERSLSFEGDSGPYLQYAHTRAVSVLEKARAQGFVPDALLAPQEVTELERMLHRFPQIVERACREHEPHYVTTYLVELASVWNSWYAVEKILDGTPRVGYRLALAQVFAQTMKNGLFVLGIAAPERM